MGWVVFFVNWTAPAKIAGAARPTQKEKGDENE
jgi:hypothetical protein